MLEARLYYFLFVFILFSCGKRGEEKINRYNHQNKKIGLWVYFNNRGDTTKKEFYDSNSNLIKATEFFNTNEAIEYTYKKGHEEVNKVFKFFPDKKNVRMINLYKDGYLKKEITYFKNKKIETETFFDINEKPTQFKQYYTTGILYAETEKLGESEVKVYDSLGILSAIVLFKKFKPVDTLYHR